jgi:hypothetical protein
VPEGMSKEEANGILKKQAEELANGVELVKGVKIRGMSDEDLSDLKDPMISKIQLFEGFSREMFVLETRLADRDSFKTHETMQNVVLALRLLKKGYISGNYTYYIQYSETGRQLSSWVMEEAPRIHHGGWAFGYHLDLREISSLKEMIEKVQAADLASRHNLSIAVKRFQHAYEEADDEDRLVDYMIAFEALFLKGEKGGASLGIVIAIACASLLGDNDQDREDMRTTLMEAYRIRNCIVHGSGYDRLAGNGENYFDILPDLVSKVEDYLRAAIRKLLK